MVITIFAKTRHNAEGKKFITYLATLKKKTGETQTVSVRFRDPCPAPKPDDCPMNIIVEKSDCNLSRKEYTNADGESAFSFTLWVTGWTKGKEYIDTSMDEYE